MKASTFTTKNTESGKAGTNLVQFLYLILCIKVVWIQLQNHFIIFRKDQNLINYNEQFNVTQTLQHSMQKTFKRQEHFYKRDVFLFIWPHPLERRDGF